MKIGFALLAERLLCGFIYYTGLFSLYKMCRGSNKTIILTYHRIISDESKRSSQILSKKNFEEHVRYLVKNYKIISLAEFAKCVTSKKNPPENSVVITFDDGYKDNFTNAYPVLKKYNAHATIFLITGLIGSKGFLTWDEIKKMVGVVDFGAHTVEHHILTSMPLGKAKQEIIKSKRGIEKKTGKSVTAFSYPRGGWGDFNKDIKKLVRDAGFSCAVTTINGDNNKESDLYELRRIGMSHENSIIVFKVKSSGMLNSLLRRFKRRAKLSVSGHAETKLFKYPY